MDTEFVRRDAVFRRGPVGSAAIALAIVGLLLAAGPALAYSPGAGIADEGKTLSYQASPDETNNVTVSLSGDTYTVVDEGVSSFPDADGTGGCSVVGNQASCPASGIMLVRIEGGNFNDILTVNAPTIATLVGGDGDDVLNAGPGDDILNGGPGNDMLQGNGGADEARYFGVPAVTVTLATTAPQNTGGGGTDTLLNVENLRGTSDNDTLNVRNGKPSRVNCLGGSNDTAIAEPGDTVDTACESTDLSPETSIDSAPPASSSDNTPTFTFSSSEGPPPAPPAFECSIDGSAFTECSSPLEATPLSDGSHTFQVRASDVFGPDPTPASASFVIDTGAPPTAIPGTQSSASGGGSPPVARPAASFVLIGGRAIKISRRGIAAIALNCLGRKDCSGRLTLSTAQRVSVGRKRHRIVRLGSANFFIRAPLTKTVKVRLGKRKLKIVRTLRRVKAVVTVTDRDTAGRTRISTRPVLVKAR